MAIDSSLLKIGGCLTHSIQVSPKPGTQNSELRTQNSELGTCPPPHAAFRASNSKIFMSPVGVSIAFSFKRFPEARQVCSLIKIPFG